MEGSQKNWQPQTFWNSKSLRVVKNPHAERGGFNGKSTPPPTPFVASSMLEAQA